METTTPSPEAPKSPPPPSTRHRGRYWWLLLLLPVLLFITMIWLTATSSGFARLWQGIGWLSNGQLRVERVSGTLWRGFQLKDIAWRDAGSRLAIDRIDVAWQPSQLWHRQLSIQRLAIGLINYTPNPAAPPSPWPTLPANLTLPLDVNVASLQIAGLTVAQGVQLYDLQGRYRYAEDRHQLVLSHVRLPQGNLAGQLTLDGQAPFALTGQLRAAAEVGSGDLVLGGSLQDLFMQGKVRASHVEVDLTGRFSPFAVEPFERVRQLDLRTQNVNPQVINAQWPRAMLDLTLHIEPVTHHSARGQLHLVNHTPGPVNEDRLPLVSVQSTLQINPGTLSIRQLNAVLTGGLLQLDGQVRKAALMLNLQLKNLNPHELDARAPQDAINGAVKVSGPMDRLRLHGNLKSQQLALDMDSTWSQPTGKPWHWHLENSKLRAGNGELVLAGDVNADRRFSLDGTLRHGDPRALVRTWPQGDLNARLRASGRVAEPWVADVALNLTPSQLNGAPVGGQMQLALAGRRLQKIVADLNIAGNSIKAQGAWGRAGDQLQAHIDAPVLTRIGFGLTGSAQGRIALSGTPALPQAMVNLNVRQLRLPGVLEVQRLSLDGKVQAGGAGLFQLTADAQRIDGGAWRINTLHMAADGHRARHRLSTDASFTVSGRPFQAQLQAVGGLLADQLDWQGTVQVLRLEGSPDLALLTPLKLQVNSSKVVLGTGRLRFAGGMVNFNGLTRYSDGRLTSQGRLDGLSLAALQPWLDVPAIQKIVVGGSWDLHADGRSQLSFARQSGELSLKRDGRTQHIALSQASLQADWTRTQTTLDVRLAADLGRVQVQGSLAAPPWRLSAQTPVSARFLLDLPQLSLLSQWADIAETGGALSADLSVTGPLSNPQARGWIRGQDLLLRDGRTGLRLAGGTLRARLDGQTLLLDQLRFASGQGEASASGRLSLKSGPGSVWQPNAAINVVIHQFSVFDRPDRRLVVSGQAALTVNEQLIKLSGQIRADEGKLSLPKEGMPSLSDDVVVVGRPVPQSALTRLPVSVDLILDLGDRFIFIGPGLNVKLAGKVQVMARPNMAPSARGQVNVVWGSYKAYGQDLQIDHGTISFVGPLDNPNINVRAKRHLSPVGAGVEVTGSVSQPRLRLIADEALTERDKLSWLLFGHAADDNAQDSNFLAIAAGQFAAGRLNDKFKVFDDLGVTHRQSKTSLNGTVSPAEQVLTVGKQLTRTFYLGYEYGLTSSQQAVKLMYQLSRRWSMLFRVGITTSAESRYTLRFD